MATSFERNPIRNRGLNLIPYGDHDEWLKIRQGYFGGSDASCIIGTNPYRSAFTLWAEKTGKAPEFEGNTATKVGTYLEDLVARMFMEETGKKVQKMNFTITNPSYPWACANIDREIIGEDAFLECKTTANLDNMKMFKNGEYPEIYYAQCVHYLAVTRCKKAYLAVLSGNRDFYIFEIERDEEEIKALMDAEQLFWNRYILGGQTPPADGSDSTDETIKKLFRVDNGTEVDLSAYEMDFLRRKTMKEQIKRLQEEVDAIEHGMKLNMGEASVGTCGNFKVTWKMQRTAALDRDAIKQDFPELDFSLYSKENRVFRVTEKKPKGAK